MLEAPSSSRQFTIWTLIKAYWQSEYRLSAYAFATLIITLTISLVALDVILSYWSNYFYDALQKYNLHGSIRLLILFFILAFIHIILAVYRYYAAQLFALRWRRWLTHQFLQRWLANRGYYYLEMVDDKTDNPEQRIQEDVGALVSTSIDLTVGLIASITTFFAFIYVLWKLSGVMTLHLGLLGTWELKGYLVWIGLIYAILGSYFTVKIGYPLIGLNFEQQRREANFRFAAMELRTHAEDVALYRGEQHQRGILNKLFNGALENWYQIILRQKLLLWFTASYNQISVALPLLAALPNYFGKVFTLGGLMQSIRAFSSVQDSLSFIVNSYSTIAQWRAISRRLTTFLNHMSEAEVQAKNENRVVYSQPSGDNLVVKQATLKTPQAKTLLQDINIDFEAGKNYLIKGRSGLGKSTFVRMLAGIWPYASGNIALPKDKTIMFLPQKLFMPLGTLAEAILFPDGNHEDKTQQLEQVMRDCHLEYLIPRLNEVASWDEQLSPGEQQRVALARVILHKPDWVILDEVTSMIDIKNEEYLYKMLKEKLPNCTIISVGHRPTLEAYHDHVIDMEQFTV